MSGEDPRAAAPGAESTLALAHALRTPLTSLALGLGLLDEGALGALNESQRDVVRALVGDVARLSILVDRALQTDRLGAYAGPIERAPVDLGNLVRIAGEPIADQAREKGVDIHLDLPTGVTVVADPVKLGWVTASLMGNALRYSPAGSTISVHLDATGEAEIRIGDQGPGVAKEVQGRIFDREGGRGLFLAREIIEAHGGRIEIRSEVGEGCVFIVTLPIARGSGGW